MSWKKKNWKPRKNWLGFTSHWAFWVIIFVLAYLFIMNFNIEQHREPYVPNVDLAGATCENGKVSAQGFATFSGLRTCLKYNSQRVSFICEKDQNVTLICYSTLWELYFKPKPTMEDVLLN